jgi:hypothetical protein
MGLGQPALLRSRLAALAARFAAFLTLRCLVVMRFRRRSDIVGMKISSVGSYCITHRPR